MRDYAQVAPTFWTRGSGKKLRGNPAAQALAMYLFTCPSANMTGLFYLPTSTMAHELGWDDEAVETSLAKIIDVGLAHYDADDGLVYLPNGLYYQLGQVNPSPADKRMKRVMKSLEQLGDHPFVVMFRARYLERREPSASQTGMIQEALPRIAARATDTVGMPPDTAPASVPVPDGGLGGREPPDSRPVAAPDPPAESVAESSQRDSSPPSAPPSSRRVERNREALPDPTAERILAELERHPELSGLDLVSLAERTAGKRLSRPINHAWTVAAIERVADMQAGKQAGHEPMPLHALGSYLSHALANPTKPAERSARRVGGGGHVPADDGPRYPTLKNDPPPPPLEDTKRAVAMALARIGIGGVAAGEASE